MINCGVSQIKRDGIPSEEISVIWQKSLMPCTASGTLSLTSSFVTIRCLYGDSNEETNFDQRSSSPRDPGLDCWRDVGFHLIKISISKKQSKQVVHDLLCWFSPDPDVLRNKKKESGAPLTAARITDGVLHFGSCFWRRQGRCWVTIKIDNYLHQI